MLRVLLSILFVCLLPGRGVSSPFSFQFPREVEDFTMQSPTFIKATDGVKLATYAFVPDEQPRIALAFYHGGGAWSNRVYQYMANKLAQEHDIATYLFDIRGHGNSEGPRGDGPSVNQVLEDVSTGLTFVAGKHPGAKLVLGGHSSGGALCLNYSGWEKRRPVDGYLLLAPYLGARVGVTREHADAAKRFIKDVSLFKLIVGAITNYFFFAHSPVVFFNYPEEEKRKDKHLLDCITNVMSAATTPNDPQKLFAGLDKPFVLLIGNSDEQFIPEKVTEFAQYATNVKDQSVVEIVPGATHLLIPVRTPDQVASGLEAICGGSHEK